jgi:SAM-dependent methyltransferase
MGAGRRGAGAACGAEARDDDAVDERLRLRRTFDSVVEVYDRARPRYPPELYDALRARTGLQRNDRVLEVGGGTGIATQQLRERGLNVTCVELGTDLASFSQARFADDPRVEVVHANFETWAPTRTFDAVVSATAWHWLDPEVRYQRAWEALRPGGHLCFWGAVHTFAGGGDPLFDELQAIHEGIGARRLGLPPETPRPSPGTLLDRLEEIEGSGLFSDAVALRFDWRVAYTADQYVDLLTTFSMHTTLSPGERDTLYGAIHDRISERPLAHVERDWGAVLHVARRID